MEEGHNFQDIQQLRLLLPEERDGSYDDDLVRAALKTKELLTLAQNKGNHITRNSLVSSLEYKENSSSLNNNLSCGFTQHDVPKLLLHDVFEQKNDIAKIVEEELEKAMSPYGYEIVQTLVVDIEPNEHEKQAMNEINAAARLQLAATEKTEAEKILQVRELGIARQRQAIVDGIKDSVMRFSVNVPGTTAKDEIGAASKSSAVFIPDGPGVVRDLATRIRYGLLQVSSAHMP
ncbi:hypothetical protein MKW98_022909 [Papaver atlanticum]|uniref:Band 7 domain-containing protein n=1 Tax=Papaver atlanticum TaxID=357466 RepID=A0AAD4TLX0_9MAGN|nr:hypothetical protein MKW98_022909 [Papaver atlanticum]